MSRKSAILKAAEEFKLKQYDQWSSSNGEQSVRVAAISPSPNEIISKVINDLKGEFSESSVVVDMGCGDGRWLTSFVKEFNCLGIGIDLSIATAEATLNSNAELSNNILLLEGDMFQIMKFTKIKPASLSNIRSYSSGGIELVPDALICYLSREGNVRMYEKLIMELKSVSEGDGVVHEHGSLSTDETQCGKLGKRVITLISVGFRMPSSIPVISYSTSSGFQAYCYKIMY